MNNIRPSQLIELLKKSPLNIIDIREINEIKNGKIPTAVAINKNLLLKSPETYLNKEKKYYIYCTQGNTSAYLVSELTKKGYNVVNIIGGYNNYLLEK